MYSTTVSSNTTAGGLKPTGRTSKRAMRPELSTACGIEKFTGTWPDGVRSRTKGWEGQLMNAGGSRSASFHNPGRGSVNSVASPTYLRECNASFFFCILILNVRFLYLNLLSPNLTQGRGNITPLFHTERLHM